MTFLKVTSYLTTGDVCERKKELTLCQFYILDDKSGDSTPLQVCV